MKRHLITCLILLVLLEFSIPHSISFQPISFDGSSQTLVAQPRETKGTVLPLEIYTLYFYNLLESNQSVVTVSIPL